MPSNLTIGYNGVHPFSEVKVTDRNSVQELLRTLLDPLEPFFSPNKARVRVPGATAVRFDQTASEVEGICRPLWGLACLLAGAGDYRGKKWWIDGIKAGTDPENPEYWQLPRDNDQRMVEMCPLGKRGREGGRESETGSMLHCREKSLTPDYTQAFLWLLSLRYGTRCLRRRGPTWRTGWETLSMRRSK